MFSLTELFGIFVCLFLLCRLLYELYPTIDRYLFRSKQNVWHPTPNNWAVVTGGTDGIGLAYCKQLLRMGYPTLIISRNPEKLQLVSDKLRTKIENCPEIRTFAFDYSKNDDQLYDNLELFLAQLPSVDVLINNVGVSFRAAEYFTIISKTSPDIFESMINVNVVSMIKMTMMVWNRMTSNNRGIILNIGYRFIH